jgi:hypothetical protein
MPRFSRRPALVGVFLGALLVTGCSGTGSGSDDIPHFDAINVDEDLSLAGPEQREALADGEVTQDEYTEGFERFRACLRAEGYELRDVELVGVVWQAGIPAEAVDSGVEAECYPREHKFVDMVWQTSHGEETTLLEALRHCLRERGLGVPSTLEEARRAVEGAGLDEATCVAEYDAL